MAMRNEPFSADDARSALRRRWFERVVMLPVGIGMISATAGFATKDILNAITGSGYVMLNHAGVPLAVVSAILAVGASVISIIRWHHR